MLIELKVANFAIIENLHIEFKKGLNILSGETGAGKTVLLKSLSLLMGGKASSETIRSGQTLATIEGSFDLSKRKDIEGKLEELGIPMEDHTLIVRRVIAAGDKSKIYLNGSLSTLQSLRDVVAPMIEVAGHTAPLIEMTGQHENRNLLSKAYHLDLLDQYLSVFDTRLAYEATFTKHGALKHDILELERNAQDKAQRLDFLVYQRDEIVKLDLSPGEEEQLDIDVKKLKNATRLNSFVDSAEGALYSDDDSAISRLHSVLQKAVEIGNIDPALAAKAESLQQAKTLIEECVYDLRQYVANIESDPNRLEEAQARLSDLRKLQKKYGPTASDILQALVEIENEVGTLENSDQRIEQMKTELAGLEKELCKVATELHKKRLKGAKVLADSVNGELADLNMKGVTFHVHVAEMPELTSTGISDVEFMSQTSSKDAPRALSKFASGGELSRILLSLKRVVGASKYPRTYLFDEVDAGVSGTTAEKVGKKLKSISGGQQVICVTHLPQVAAAGDSHFYIQKSPKSGGVSMEVFELKKKDRIEEIARLISGEKITKTSLAHAEELLREASV